jgi:hypothetical protein
MTPRDAELMAFCQRWLEAWTGNRPEELIKYYSPDAQYRDPARPQGLVGREALLGYFRRLLAANPAWVWVPLEVQATERGCWLKWRATIPTERGEVVEEGLDLVELRDGKITRNEVYFDRTSLLAAG